MLLLISTMAPFGQVLAQGASSQWWQKTAVALLLSLNTLTRG
ncbi:oxidoreductase [Yersinia frederiksenii ATCC 33641]|nr:oxidoreductase [Yersinia frederiksenii ATCC 33641]